MYKYETHMHTCEASACATASGAEQARRYKEADYDGIIITDHFFNGNTAILNYTDWEDRINKYCLGYEHAKEEGEKIGLKVFFGFEYTYFGADSLVYGLDKDWLIKHPEIMAMSYYQFCNKAHEDGGYIVHAHPFREADRYINEIKLFPRWVDAVEIHNSGNNKQIFNDRARWYAETYDKPVTAGTDNHHLWVQDLSGVKTEQPLNSIEDYIDAVKNRRVEIIIPEIKK